MGKGLRQGYSLYVFLFNIVVKGICRLFFNARAISLLRGVDIGNKPFLVSLLQFANDT